MPRAPIRLDRPHRTAGAARPLARQAVPSRDIRRTAPLIIEREASPAPYPVEGAIDFQPDPYLDYGRFLTPEGGVLFIYKDIDTRLRHTLWRLFAWTLFTGGEAWLLLLHSPVHQLWINIVLLIAAALVNALIVAKPVEIYRRLEIRPDCLIIEAAEIFWKRQMEGGFPSFRPDAEGNQVLSGIYGTRFVDYLTVRRFDEFDRTPEVFAAHLSEAMAQLWNPFAS